MSARSVNKKGSKQQQPRGQTQGPRRPPSADVRGQTHQPRPTAAATVRPVAHTPRTPAAENLIQKWEDTPEFFTALERFVNETMRRTTQDLFNEFQELNGLPLGEPSAEFVRNTECNRYRDILCTEQSRVRLANGRYIHANWIRALGESRFICTQGPLPTTCDEFWTMIVQEDIGAIVMLCDVIEQQRIKCHQYWPTQQEPILRFANDMITVRFLGETHVEGSLHRTHLAISAPTMRSNYMQLQHYHWRQWPDRGVPQSDLAPLRLLLLVQRIPRMVVHCSAGIGRTGTLVAVYLAYHTLQLGQRLNICNLIRDLRQQRAQSIQTMDQYLYLYYVILRYAANKASKLNIDSAALEAFMQGLNGKIKRG